VGTLIDTNGDWVAIAEAAQREAASDEAWAEGVLAAARGVLLTDSIALLSAVFPEAKAPELRVFVGGITFGELAFSQLSRMVQTDRSAIDTFFFPPSIVNTHSRLAARATPLAREAMAHYRSEAGIADALGAVVNPTTNESTVLFAGSKQTIALRRTETELLTRTALHVEAGLRMRRRPEVVRAVLAPDGRIVHLEAGAPPRARLEEATRRVERTRTRRHRRSPEALALWTALVDGDVSLVERFDGGKRFYFVLENPPERRPMRALTRGELDVVTDAARGLSAKLIAYGHGISAPRVSQRLASAAAKLGLASRVELVRLAALLCHPTRPTLSDAALTAAEREVLDLVRAGFSNAEIARHRNRSVRTIANQVARLLEKSGSPTRRALVTRA
jgi:DNA-binding CsgD family transcriptional regulator